MSYNSKAQTDSLNYTFSMGVSVLEFWDRGFEVYKLRIRNNFQDDILSRNLFINNFTVGAKVEKNGGFGRLTYLFATDFNSYKIVNVNLSYGKQKKFLNDKLIGSVELGAGFGNLVVAGTRFGREANINAGFELSVNVWKGFNIENRFNATRQYSLSKILISHTFSLSYTFGRNY